MGEWVSASSEPGSSMRSRNTNKLVNECQHTDTLLREHSQRVRQSKDSRRQLCNK